MLLQLAPASHPALHPDLQVEVVLWKTDGLHVLVESDGDFEREKGNVASDEVPAPVLGMHNDVTHGNLQGPGGAVGVEAAATQHH